jgi:hypothetical protein
MAWQGRALLLVALVLIPAPALAGSTLLQDAVALCGGERFPVETVHGGASPYIALRVLGVSGQFLLDYGATRSSLSARAFGTQEGVQIQTTLPFAHPISGDFRLRHYNLASEPEGRQIGVIGTELLSQVSVQLTQDAVFVGAQACSPDVLRHHGFLPINQSRYFAADREAFDLPNVPVVFLRIGETHAFAQIDTGYDDTVYAHSIDINESLFENLVKAGAHLHHVADIGIATCEGHETRHVYTFAPRSLIIETDQAVPIRSIESFHLIVKPTSGCGGIGSMQQPAAQLGASFLRDFATIIFDPFSRQVWIDGARSTPNGD